MIYSHQLETILLMIGKLNEIEKATEEAEKNHHSVPYMKAIQLTDGDGIEWGELRDDIGGDWAWKPPEWASQ